MNEPTPFIWTELIIPAPISLDAARAALTSLAGLSGQPRIVLEATGRDGEVSWKLGARAADTSRILRALTAQIPDLRAERMRYSRDELRADTAAALRVRGDRTEPMNHAAIEPSTRGVLQTLASTKKAELLHIQLILGPRFRPTRPLPSARRQASRPDEHRFACEVRVAASTPDPARSRGLIEGVVGALRLLESPGVRLQLSRASIRSFSEGKSPLLWSSRLSVSDLVPLTGWPVAAASAAHLPGVPSAHPRVMPPSTPPRIGRSVGASTTNPGRALTISVEDSTRHLHLIGPTGVGKSTLMARLALQDIAAGRGVVVIDPKGDLVDDILARLDSRRLDDVVVLDARDQMPVGLNPLATSPDPDLTADVLLSLFRSLYGDGWLPRTHELLQASLLTLARRGDASIVMLPLLLTNPGFRRSVIGQASKSDPLGVGAYWSWFEGISEAERQQATAPLLRRLRPILMRPGIRGIFGQRDPKFSIADVFTKRRILLVSLAKGTIGPDAADLLGSIVVSQLWTAALARTAIAAERRHPVMVHIDEVQDYLRLPGDLGDALAQARGLGVGYSLAHQHLHQLPREIHRAVMANARSRVAFQLDHADAREIAATTRGQLLAEDFESLPAYRAYANLLHANENRGWASLNALPLDPPLREATEVRARSRANFGQPLDQIEADLLNLIEPAPGDDEPLGRTRRRPSEGGAS